MNDFYSAATQVIPILLLAIVVEIRLPTTARVASRSRLRVAVAIASAAEALALAGLSFDEERFPFVNEVVASVVWLAIVLLLAVFAILLPFHQGAERAGGS